MLHLPLLFFFEFLGLFHALVVNAELHDCSLEILARVASFDVHSVVEHRAVQQHRLLVVELCTLVIALHFRQLFINVVQQPFLLG